MTDIGLDHQGRTVVIEYDGVHWHRADATILVDQRKRHRDPARS